MEKKKLCGIKIFGFFNTGIGIGSLIFLIETLSKSLAEHIQIKYDFILLQFLLSFYLISGIGILLLKKWAPKFTVILSALVSIALIIFNILLLDLLKGIKDDAVTVVFRFGAILISAVLLIYYFANIYVFSRPKINELFR